MILAGPGVVLGTGMLAVVLASAQLRANFPGSFCRQFPMCGINLGAVFYCTWKGQAWAFLALSSPKHFGRLHRPLPRRVCPNPFQSKSCNPRNRCSNHRPHDLGKFKAFSGALVQLQVGKYMLPYGWDWPTALLFGSILSATDPVAVVAIFNSLGVSPRLRLSHLPMPQRKKSQGSASAVAQPCVSVGWGMECTAQHRRCRTMSEVRRQTW
eukprot:5911205-Amphidinium_carterae.1